MKGLAKTEVIVSVLPDVYNRRTLGPAVSGSRASVFTYEFHKLLAALLVASRVTARLEVPVRILGPRRTGATLPVFTKEGQCAIQVCVNVSILLEPSQ